MTSTIRHIGLAALLGVLTGCATTPKTGEERAYISVGQSDAAPGRCDFTLSNAREYGLRDGWYRRTRDFPPPQGSLRSSATYSYATQSGLSRPTADQARCIVIVREKSSYEGPPYMEIAFELRSIDAETVEIRPRQAILRSSALWRTAVPRVSVSAVLGLVDPRSRGRDAPPLPTREVRPLARLLDQAQADMGPLSLGDGPVPIDAAPVTLHWPETSPTMRVIAVVGERLRGRPSPDRRIMARQVDNIGVRYDDWPPAR